MNTVDVVITFAFQDHMLYHYHQDTKQLVLSGYVQDTNHYNYGVIDRTYDEFGYPLSVCLVGTPYAIIPGAHVECALLGSRVNVNGRKVYDVAPVQASMPLAHSLTEFMSLYKDTKQTSMQEYREARERYMCTQSQTPVQRNKITHYYSRLTTQSACAATTSANRFGGDHCL